jgi:CheY-like chemotaxis protein
METRILVIEDDPPSLELMGYLLRAFGYTPITVETGERGLEAAQNQNAPPDLILCDIQLPGIDGHQVARRLKGDPVLAQVPLVAVTALAMVGDRDKVLASGFDGYISNPIVPESFGADGFLLRPVEPPVIVAAVEDALGKHQNGKKT